MKNLETNPSPSLSIRHKNPLLDLLVPTNGGPKTVGELADRYYLGRYGQAMRQQPLRFEANFGGFPRQQILADYGPDACPVDHQRYATDFLYRVVEAEERHHTLYTPDPKDLPTLALGMATHDFGESTHEDIEYFYGDTLGDIPAGSKTNKDRITELNIRQLMNYIHFSDVDPAVLERIEAIVGHRENSLIHDLYEAAHNLQTLDTTIRAGRALERAKQTEQGEDSPRLIALRGMTTVVRNSATSKLQAYRHLVSVNHALTAVEHADQQRRYRHVVTADNARYHHLCCQAS